MKRGWPYLPTRNTLNKTANRQAKKMRLNCWLAIFFFSQEFNDILWHLTCFHIWLLSSSSSAFSFVLGVLWAFYSLFSVFVHIYVFHFVQVLFIIFSSFFNILFPFTGGIFLSFSNTYFLIPFVSKKLRSNYNYAVHMYIQSNTDSIIQTV